MKRKPRKVLDEKSYRRVGRDHGRRKQSEGAALQVRSLLEAEGHTTVAGLLEAAEGRVTVVARDLKQIEAKLELAPSLNGCTPPPLVRQREGEIRLLVLRRAELESDLEDIARLFERAKERVEAEADRCQAAYFAERFDASESPVRQQVEPIKIALSLDLRGLREEK